LQWVSRAICLEVVPEQTRPWNPEQAPQAMVTNRKGNSIPKVPGPDQPRKEACLTSKCPKKIPTTPMASAR
jgi:hypothetical protein